MSFEVIPTIDIRGGKCVRLYQGDFAQETVFSEDPVGVARRWESSGAPRIHVVDLDGAASGEPVNTPIIREIVAAVSAPVQVGGGLRTMGAIAKLLSLGVERVVLGTVAAEDPGLLQEACRRFGESIAVGVDARDGLVATHGWKKPQRITALELVSRVEALGVGRIVYTDIARDGALTGPNFQSIAQLLEKSKARVIASGGVSSLDHLRRLAEMKVDGAIVGRALYTEEVDLKEAIAATAKPER